VRRSKTCDLNADLSRNGRGSAEDGQLRALPLGLDKPLGAGGVRSDLLSVHGAPHRLVSGEELVPDTPFLHVFQHHHRESRVSSTAQHSEVE